MPSFTVPPRTTDLLLGVKDFKRNGLTRRPLGDLISRHFLYFTKKKHRRTGLILGVLDLVRSGRPVASNRATHQLPTQLTCFRAGLVLKRNNQNHSSTTQGRVRLVRSPAQVFSIQSFARSREVLETD